MTDKVPRYRIRSDGFIQRYLVRKDRAGPPLPEGFSSTPGVAYLVENGELVAYFFYAGPFGDVLRVNQWVSAKRGAGRRLLRLAATTWGIRVWSGSWSRSGMKAAKDVLLPLGFELREFHKRFGGMMDAVFYKGELPKIWGGP